MLDRYVASVAASLATIGDAMLASQCSVMIADVVVLMVVVAP